MREVSANTITDIVEKLCVSANCFLNDDIYGALINAGKSEENASSRAALKDMIENADIARKENIPICQDTGMAVVFAEVGQEVHITDGSLTDAINEGVRRGYTNGYLRKSVVGDPLLRENTRDNTPAVIHYDLVPGDKIKIKVLPKGFGSENKSALKMLTPADGREGIVRFVVETVKKAGASPCPPIVVGVGIGGTMEKAAILAKQALGRDVGSSSDLPHIRSLEEELFKAVNELDIGPAGFGGSTTALGVNVETYPTHIAGLPVAVNISCHVTRHAAAEI